MTNEHCMLFSKLSKYFRVFVYSNLIQFEVTYECVFVWNKSISLFFIFSFLARAMDLNVDYFEESGRLINIANYANLTGYFVLLGIFFVFAFAIFLFFYDLKTAPTGGRSGNYEWNYGRYGSV